MDILYSAKNCNHMNNNNTNKIKDKPFEEGLQAVAKEKVQDFKDFQRMSLKHGYIINDNGELMTWGWLL